MTYLYTLKKAILLVMVISLIFKVPSFAQLLEIPVNQSLGLIDSPTAKLVKHGIYRVNLSGGAGMCSVGLFDYFELGLLAFNINDKFFFGHTLGVKLLEEGEYLPALAVGAESIKGDDPQLGREGYHNSYYAVASKNMGIFVGHMGIGNGRFLGEGETSQKLHGIFGGIERTFFEDSPNRLILMLEEDGRDINFGIRYGLMRNLDVVLTLAELDNWLFSHSAPNDKVRLVIGLIYENQLPPVNRGVSKHE